MKTEKIPVTTRPEDITKEFIYELVADGSMSFLTGARLLNITVSDLKNAVSRMNGGNQILLPETLFLKGMITIDVSVGNCLGAMINENIPIVMSDRNMKNPLLLGCDDNENVYVIHIPTNEIFLTKLGKIERIDKDRSTDIIRFTFIHDNRKNHDSLDEMIHYLFDMIGDLFLTMIPENETGKYIEEIAYRISHASFSILPV